MTDLISRANALARSADKVVALRQLESDAEGLQTRSDDVSKMAAALERLARAASVMTEAGVSTGINQDRVRGIRQAAEIVASKFGQDPRSAVNPDPDSRNMFWERVEGLTQLVETSLLVKWKAHQDAVLPTIEAEIVNVLAMVPGAREGVTRLRAAMNEARSLAALPQSPAEVAKLTEVAGQAEEAIASLGADSVPEPVRRFLHAASADEATLADVTEDVAKWLEAWGLTDRVRVSLA